MRFKLAFISTVFCSAFSVLISPQGSLAQTPASPAAPGVSSSTVDAPEPQNLQGAHVVAPDRADISGTVTDVYGDIVPGATVLLEGTKGGDRQSATANDDGFFEFRGLNPGSSYHITVSATGFEPWLSEPVVLNAGQYFDMTGIKLKLENTVTSVTVTSSTEEIATQQVQVEEQQRVFGFIPNFYVVYDSKDAVPMTTKLKFKLALRTAVDPVSIGGAAFLGGIDQASNRPDYQQGLKGYGQRFGSVYADGFTDIMFGGAILPALLHQDPRYFYQGTGTVKSRMLHALSNPFICKGDNGHSEINFSSMGGDLISSAISNAYYPESNRGASMVFSQFLISTGEREVSSLVQEFVLRKLTPNARKQKLDPAL